MKRLSNKNIVIIGGTSGIGQESVIKLAENGANIVFCGRNISNGKAVEEQAKRNNTIVKYVKCDVQDKESIALFFEEALSTLGKIDCAFNNAGIEGELASFAESTEKNWDHVIDVNLKGMWYCMKHEISHMLVQGQGNILNMASTAGLLGNAFGMSAYSASKHAIIGLTKSVALEYAKQKIRINALCPGFVETPMVDNMCSINLRMKKLFTAVHPIGRMGTPEEIANAVVFLLSDESSFMTGSSFIIDGGLTT